MTELAGMLSYRGGGEPFVGRLTTNPNMPKPLRATEALLMDRPAHIDTSGFKAVFVKQETSEIPGQVGLPKEFWYLGSGDIVRFNPLIGHLRVLYRKRAVHNSLLVTERCNSKCLMCSQPPRDVDDGFLVDELLTAIPLMSPETPALGFTGGEITLLHGRFLAMIQATKNYLPETQIDVLSNGRLLCYLEYARKIAEVEHPHLTMCIPLYSDVDSVHDFVVQAKGAFDQTVRGILNLARVGVPTEVRVVLHQQTIPGLVPLATFLARNFPFLSHVALMGLEMTGFTKANLGALWIDPADYQAELQEAVDILDAAKMHVSIYNHQLCLLPEPLWRFSRQSISDWKNIYMPVCESCTKRHECGGFFASAPLRYSDHLRAFS